MSHVNKAKYIRHSIVLINCTYYKNNMYSNIDTMTKHNMLVLENTQNPKYCKHFRYIVVGSEGQSKNIDDTVHGLVLPSHGTASITWVVPEACAGCLQTCSIFLHDDTRYNIFERLSQLAELTEALLHYTGAPLVNSAVLVGISSYGCFYWLQRQLKQSGIKHKLVNTHVIHLIALQWYCKYR